MNTTEMNKPDQRPTCEPYELLISCQMDGEIDQVEQDRLQAHLQMCGACRERVQSFELLNDLLVGDQAAAPIELQTRISDIGQLKTNGRNWKLFLKRVIPTAVAASVVLGMFAINWPVEKAAATTAPVTAEQIVDPLVLVSDLNLQRMQDQQAMIETLQLELRALRLELARMNDPEESKRLSQKLDVLLTQINSL